MSTPPHTDPATVTAAVHAILHDHAGLEGPLLPVLHAVHARFGHIPPEAVPTIADALALGRAEVHGVISFHHEFRSTPAGRRVIRLCRAEACQAVGARALAAHARDRLGIGWNQTTEDGAVTLEAVYCLGLCACGPAALVDGVPVGRVTPGTLDQLVATA
ncbi:formate dehydrogenase subunit gamma [Rhodobaculum claviforme]|uniref:Formate dehydrogenase subunit gamma n=1 Tax=Rhodobaculum claviforme TaxID=1549854 RepID=A0A934WJ34_9RHOB|nr:formate dehydrogenase subunit gamma [Rhodobaculum claviforme]MBK5927512.1 formate dehydrogenase subunit gamma [Rhodobaculum claviforme]